MAGQIDLYLILKMYLFKSVFYGLKLHVFIKTYTAWFFPTCRSLDSFNDKPLSQVFCLFNFPKA